MSTATLENTKNTTLIQVRVPEGLKERTSKLFKSLGTSTSDVIRMMLIQADETKSIPFRIRTDTYPYTMDETMDEIKATFAMEDMPLDEQDMQDLKDVEFARITPDALREKYIAEYKESGEES